MRVDMTAAILEELLADILVSPATAVTAAALMLIFAFSCFKEEQDVALGATMQHASLGVLAAFHIMPTAVRWGSLREVLTIPSIGRAS